MFIIRKVRKSDLGAVFEIEKASHESPWDMRAFECEYSKSVSGANIFLVAEDPDTAKIAGFIAGDIIVDYIGILNVAVAPWYRRRGIGTELMKKIETEAFKKGLKSLTLEVRENNKDAVSVYRKLGYVEKGRRERYYQNTHDALLMWKHL